ncbi:hypothetical protein, partial [Glaesserella parasuis]|uniref:hypothetical protein n=1 Tax=Glaesserella parasuis TaxID=738 RepID=UPI003F365992
MNSEDRAAARAFDPRAAAAELKPDVEQAQDLFEQARGDRYGQLQNQARETFDHSVVPNVIDHLEASIADANRLNTTKAVSPILADVYGMITEGNGLTSQGLKPGPAAEATPQEMFNRLQQARQTLD